MDGGNSSKEDVQMQTAHIYYTTLIIVAKTNFQSRLCIQQKHTVIEKEKWCLWPICHYIYIMQTLRCTAATNNIFIIHSSDHYFHD